jgi:SAM-dependent methyltransferase
MGATVSDAWAIACGSFRRGWGLWLVPQQREQVTQDLAPTWRRGEEVADHGFRYDVFMTTKPASCPVCAGPYMAHVRKIFDTDLFACLECLSFCSPFAKPHPPAKNYDWHLKVADRNAGWARELFKHLDPTYVLEVGSGIGTTIRVAKEQGGDGVGFDLNAPACEYGRDVGLLDLRAEMWSRQTPLKRPPTSILCIMVLEHIHQPRPLLEELVRAGAEHSCPVFVSVPWFNKNWWPHLLTDPQPGAPVSDHPLAQPTAHVTHFSRLGFELACKSFGAKATEALNAGGWRGFVVRS